MEEYPKTNAGQGLGIAGLVIGIITVFISFIPCIGLLALLPGAVAVVLSGIALNQANRGNGAKGLIIAALVVSIFGTTIAAVWGLFFASVATEGERWKNKIENFGNEFEEDFEEEMEDEFEDIGTELEDALKELEYGDLIEEEWDQMLSNEEFDSLINEYELLVIEMVDVANRAEQSDFSEFGELGKLSAKAVKLALKLSKAVPKFTEEQKKEFEKLQEKYDKIIEEENLQ
jgi:hypothetical protein